jgi:uncharacterized protein YggE
MMTNTQSFIARNLFAGTLLALTLGMAATAKGQADMMRPVAAMSISEGITAHGHGEVKVKPDIALLTIAVTTQSKNQADAVSENSVRTTAVLKALKDAGIATKDIQTQSYTVQPQYDYEAKPPALTGYQVQNSVQATVRDLTRVGLVIDKTTAAGASQISGVSFDLSDRSKAESNALALAVASARRKAGVMAEAAGVDLGRLLTLTEGSDAPQARPIFLGAMRAMSADSAPVTPIADQQITVTADATLVYAMGAAK